MKTKNFTSRDIIVKMTRIKQNLKATRDTQIVRSACVHVCVRTCTHTHTHKHTKFSSRFLSRNDADQRVIA